MHARNYILVALLLAGCKTPATPTHTTPGAGVAGHVVSNGGGSVVAQGGGNVVAQGGGNIVAQGGGNIVAQGGDNLVTSGPAAEKTSANIVAQGGGNVLADGLTGVVSAPAGIVAQGGGNLIGNDGASLIGNDGAGYRLAGVLEQRYLRGAKVRLLDAAGKPLLDKANKPFETVTDAKGRYAFPSGLPARGVRVVVDLGAAGQLQAIAPKSRTGTEVAVDMVSTLTSGYILGLVASQADPQATLDRLPADAEKKTRDSAAAALVAGGKAPDTLKGPDVMAAVVALRAKDAALDGQLEAVRKLLIVAGQSDLGNGLPGPQVDLPAVGAVLALADGSALIAAPSDGRVWRLRPDGIMETYVGSGGVNYADPAGLAGPEATLHGLLRMALDAQGRLVVLDGKRVLRLGADKKVEVLARDLDDATGVFATDPVQVVANGKLRTIAAAAPLGTVPAAQAYVLNNGEARGRDAQGRLYFCVRRETNAAPLYEAWRADATGQGLTLLATSGVAGVVGLTVDPQGTLVVVDAQHRLVARPPEGAERVLAAQLPKDFMLLGDAAALAPDGSAFVVQQSTVWKAKDGAIALVAGSQGGIDGPATRVALHGPAGLALDPNGDLYVVENDANRVDVFPAGGHGRVIAGTGEADQSGDGGPATAATLQWPTALRRDAQGNAYVLEDNESAIRKIDAAGTITLYYEPAGTLTDFVARADGTLLLIEDDALVELGLDKKRKKLADLSEHSASLLGLAPNGDVYLSGGGAIERFADGKLTFLAEPDDNNNLNANLGGGVAVGADGAVYVAARDSGLIMRYSPTTHLVTVLAGSDGKALHGSHVDDAVGEPCYPLIDPKSGDLLFADAQFRQIKRIPASALVD
ncbi:MAG: repeat containing protein [Cyanobacteria bacterium RYN_339]|nr:repeat containing protein [Cyanobacteria bacterium RYN_339]